MTILTHSNNDHRLSSASATPRSSSGSSSSRSSRSSRRSTNLASCVFCVWGAALVAVTTTICLIQPPTTMAFSSPRLLGPRSLKLQKVNARSVLLHRQESSSTSSTSPQSSFHSRDFSIFHATSNDEEYDDDEDEEEDDEDYYDDDDMISSNNNDNIELSQKDGKNRLVFKVTNDFQTFLNQCSIQSMVLLLSSVRDRQTALWLEDFTQPIFRQRSNDTPRDYLLSNMALAGKIAQEENKKKEHQKQQQQQQNEQESESIREVELLSYHGLGVINTTLFPTWDSYYEQLLNQEDESYIIQNPSPYVPDYELEIKPASLCTRLISVREQIGREFVKDLDVIADMGGITLETYWEKLKQSKKKKTTTSNGNTNDNNDNIDSSQMNLLFLEFPADEDSDLLPSPTRKGNFDLLVLLATQESIHRLLNRQDNDQEQEEEEVSLVDRYAIQFLRNFYLQRLPTHFTGNQWYGRADSLLEELLSLPPSTIQIQQQQQKKKKNEEAPDVALIDPMRIVELILQEREQVAEEWADQALDIPELHMQIKRKQLNRLMGIVDTPTEERSSFE